ncbi:MAG: hypothetical protein SFU86_03295 [Pirellulaceae bacterium]|nr:hypothetical protein [Pirellulaceae bacterium]
MSLQHFATCGSRLVWEQGGRPAELGAVIGELTGLGLKHDLVVWRRVTGQPDSLAATLWYSPRGYTVQQFAYVNWPSVEAMTDEEAAEAWQGLHDVFTGRKVT